MCKNSIYFQYNPGHVTLSCLEVVPVVYASVLPYVGWGEHLQNWFVGIICMHPITIRAYPGAPAEPHTGAK